MARPSRSWPCLVPTPPPKPSHLPARCTSQGVADWLISWIPLYYPLKLGFILWLQLPSTQGATRIYMQFVQPQLKLHEGRIDGSLDQARSFATTSVQDIRQKGVATWGSEMLQRAKSRSAAGGSSAQQDNSAHVA